MRSLIIALVILVSFNACATKAPEPSKPIVTHAISTDKEESLVKAVMKNDYELVQKLLREGVSPNIKTSSGVTPIIFSLLHESIKLYELLTRYGADINYNLKTKSTGDSSVLKMAIQYKRPQAISYLFENGASYQDMSVIRLAINSKDIEILRLVLQYANAKTTSSTGVTPLMSVINSNANIKMFELLLQEGADVNAEFQGMNLLEMSLTTGYYDGVELLSQYGFNIDKHYPISKTSKITQLEYQLIMSNEKGIRALLNAGADITKVSLTDYMAKLLLKMGHTDILKTYFAQSDDIYYSKKFSQKIRDQFESIYVELLQENRLNKKQINELIDKLYPHARFDTLYELIQKLPLHKHQCEVYTYQKVVDAQTICNQMIEVEQHQGRKSWFYLLNQEYDKTISHGLSIVDQKEYNYVYSNIAHAYLLKGDISKAKEHYTHFMTELNFSFVYNEIIRDLKILSHLHPDKQESINQIISFVTTLYKQRSEDILTQGSPL
jgi:tetratricopeptide (TPR) repeat protein